ncbi:uncharacterized protein LOC144606247 [Rhinoraja longicauda]
MNRLKKEMENSRRADKVQVYADEDRESVLLFSDNENEAKHLQKIAGVKAFTKAVSSTKRGLSTNTSKPFDHIGQAVPICLSNSSDTVNSLFKTQSPSVPVGNKRRKSARTPSTRLDVTCQNGLDADISSDSDVDRGYPSILRNGKERRQQRCKASTSSHVPKEARQRRGGPRSSMTAAQKRKRLRERGLEFPFVEQEYGTKDLPFKMIYTYEQTALCGLFDYMKELKCQKHLIKSLKNIDVDCADREGCPTRQYKYLDEKGPLSPISEISDESCIEDFEIEEAFDVKIVANSCFIVEKPEKKKKCSRKMHRSGKNKRRPVKSGENKHKHKAKGRSKDHIKNKPESVEEKNRVIQYPPPHVPFKRKSSKVTKGKVADQTAVDPCCLQNTSRPLDKQGDEETETTLSRKKSKSNKDSKKIRVQREKHLASQEENIPESALTMCQKVLYNNGTTQRHISQERDNSMEQANKGAKLSSKSVKKKKRKLDNGTIVTRVV